MAAVILDDESDVVGVTKEAQVVSETEEVEELQGQPEEAQEVEAPEEPELPEKYQGKSMADIVRMHQEAEKLAHRHSQEIGELRKAFDTHVQSQLSQQQAPQSVEDDDDDLDYYTDPEKAVARAIDNHPSVKSAKEAALKLQRQEALSNLKSMHPDMDKVFNDTKFGEWVKGSPFRTGLLRKAHFEYDIGAADELLSLWKDRQSVVNETAQAEKAARKTSTKQASTGAKARGSAEPSGRKIYRRTDIINLMKNDPNRYEALSNEIMQAYAEGRVR